MKGEDQQPVLQNSVTLKGGGGCFIPAALKSYKAKTLAQLLCESFVGPASSCFMPQGKVQSKFLRAVLQVPRCMSNARVRLETGSIESKLGLAYYLSIYICD